MGRPWAHRACASTPGDPSARQILEVVCLVEPFGAGESQRVSAAVEIAAAHRARLVLVGCVGMPWWCGGHPFIPVAWPQTGSADHKLALEELAGVVPSEIPLTLTLMPRHRARAAVRRLASLDVVHVVERSERWKRLQAARPFAAVGAGT